MNFADILRFDTPCHFTSVDKICFHKTTEKVFAYIFQQIICKHIENHLVHTYCTENLPHYRLKAYPFFFQTIANMKSTFI